MTANTNILALQDSELLIEVSQAPIDTDIYMVSIRSNHDAPYDFVKELPISKFDLEKLGRFLVLVS